MNTKKFIINIRANEGYAPEQVRSRMTVGELRRILEDYDDDLPVITNDENNSYGANWGTVVDTDEWEQEKWAADIVATDKETGEKEVILGTVYVHECDSTFEEEELMRELGVPEKYFDKAKYDLDWEEK